jgi:hypothetical protein
MPAMLDIQEVGIRRILVQNQPLTNSSWASILKNPSQKKSWGNGSRGKIQARVSPWVQTSVLQKTKQNRFETDMDVKIKEQSC